LLIYPLTVTVSMSEFLHLVGADDAIKAAHPGVETLA